MSAHKKGHSKNRVAFWVYVYEECKTLIQMLLKATLLIALPVSVF